MSAFKGGILGRSFDSTSSAVEFFELALIKGLTTNIAVVAGNCRTAIGLMQQLPARNNPCAAPSLCGAASRPIEEST
jgi:hypothetical protein